MSSSPKYSYPGTATANKIFGVGKNNTNTADLARLAALKGKKPISNKSAIIDKLEDYVKAVHQNDTSAPEALATRVGVPNGSKLLWEYKRLKRRGRG